MASSSTFYPSLKNAYLIYAALCLALLPSCAMMDSSLEQKVDILSVPAGARCKVTQSNKASWRSSMVTGHEDKSLQEITTVTTPGSALVPRGAGDLHVLCHLDGYKDTATSDPAYQSIWVSQGEWKYTSPVTVVMARP